MAHFRCEFYSDVLNLSTSMTVILPQRTETQIGLAGAVGEGPPPLLYLLHGLSDDDTIWLRRTSIERYAAPLGLAVVMPQVARSLYADEVHGGRYWTFLSEELPSLVGSFFNVSDRREDTFVAGLSMGGYGAMKWALTQPERFAAAASLSGVLDLGGKASPRDRPEEPGLLQRVFGDTPVAGGPNDLLWLLGQADRVALPELYVACGMQDPLYPHNVTFTEACAEKGVAVQTTLDQGEHEWGYWDVHIQDVLAWLPLQR
jgi:putative tributyrin esterase